MSRKARSEDFFEPHNERLYEHLGVNFGWQVEGPVLGPCRMKRELKGWRETY
jgi:hypothetical protein